MAGCCGRSAASSITGLIGAGANVTITGSGTTADPYIISTTGGGTAEITGLIEAGDNVVLSGTGTIDDPYVVVSNASGLVTAGDGVTVTGDGTTASPFVVSADPAPTEITGLLEAGTNETLTGTGTSADPYVLSANATGLLTAGTDVTITGSGTAAAPYVISSTAGPANSITGLISEGNNVSITGTGTTGDPYVLESPVTGLVTAGTNVTLTGTGTEADPYIISAADGTATFLTAGDNVTITGTGTEADPFVVASQAPPRGAPQELTLQNGATSNVTVQVRENGDGSATFNGWFDIPGPLTSADYPVVFASLPQGPEVGGAYSTNGRIQSTGEYVPVRIDLNPGPGSAAAFILGPDLAEGDVLTVYLEGLTYWLPPAA